MQLTKLVLSLLAVNKCNASAGAIVAKTAGAVAGKVTDLVVNLNPWAAGAVAVGSVSGVGWKYLGNKSHSRSYIFFFYFCYFYAMVFCTIICTII